MKNIKMLFQETLCLPVLFKGINKKIIQVHNRSDIARRKNFIKENLIARFSKETEVYLSILITVEGWTASSKEGRVNKKRL